jgi:hypothetical protein
LYARPQARWIRTPSRPPFAGERSDSLFRGINALGGVQLAQAAAAQLAAFQDAAAHEAAFQDAAAQLALDHDADAQLADAQDAFAHDALDQDADAQLALFQEALFHEASAVAVLAQLAASKTLPPEPSETTKPLRARFGFGGLVTSEAALAFTSPTPSARPAEVGRALTMRAPLTWSGVQPGCAARMSAAAPETTGAEKDVPDIHM